MLISIVLTLSSPVNLSLPTHVGRANQAIVLANLGRLDHALAESLHAGEGVKPFTVSSFLDSLPERGQTTIVANKTYHVRVTGLAPTVSQALEAALLQERPAEWIIDSQHLQVLDAICDPAIHGWSGKTSYEALAASQMLQSKPPPRQVTLEFASPTAFKSTGNKGEDGKTPSITMPIPLPGLVFGSLVDRWNAFSPVTLSPELRRFGEEMVAISRLKLESQPVEMKQGSMRIGSVGRVTYAALGGDRYWLSVMQMLADFALYSGVGMMSTVGMGQARRVVRGEQ